MPDPDHQAIHLKAGTAAECEYLVQYEVCDDPFCDCMILTCLPTGDDTEMEDSLHEPGCLLIVPGLIAGNSDLARHLPGTLRQQ